MTKVLTAIGGKVVAVMPVLDVDNTTIIGLNVSFNMLYKDLVGNVQSVGTAELFNGWAVLSAQQRANMQDIRDTVVAAITAAFIT
jgi:hypothetical protein